MGFAAFGVRVSRLRVLVYPSGLQVLLAPELALGPPQTLPSMAAYICKEGELQLNPNPVITLSH